MHFDADRDDVDDDVDDELMFFANFYLRLVSYSNYMNEIGT